VQLCLLPIPAIIQHGTMLSLEVFGRWYTSAHVLGGWRWRIRPPRTNALLSEKDPQPTAELAALETIAAPDERPAQVIQTPTRSEPIQHYKPQPLTLF
jgi:hypothetical protein